MLLNCHSYYSLRYGTLSVEELLQAAVERGHHTLALTDINNTSAGMDFLRMAPLKGIRPAVGVDFRNGVQQLYVALARNNAGWQEINRHLSLHLHNDVPIQPLAPDFEHVWVIYPFSACPERALRPYEFIGVGLNDLNRLRFTPLIRQPHKLVLMHTCTFVRKSQFNAHRLLRSVALNTLLSKLPPDQQALPDQQWLSAETLIRQTEDFPFLIAHARRLLDDCKVEMTFGSDGPPKNRKTYTGSAQNDLQLLRRLCRDGLAYRYGNPTRAVTDRIEKELEIIVQKNFLSYFLINWDITRYARSKGYFYVGRGSGANSVVAYLLRITDVDPIELDLYFERFINLYRQNPPDFDLDFSWTDRDDVTRYIFDRFPNAALLATYNTFQYRAVIRELGKVFGLPAHEIDKLSESRGNPNGLDELSRLVLKYSQLIHGFPSHLSIHAGGILISEEPLQAYTATWMPPKGFPTTQFDMVVAEDIGLYKFDILSQRGLGKIKDAVTLVRQNRPECPPIDIHDIKAFKEDESIKELLRSGKAIGCFYVESPAMRMLLSKLRVDNYLALVAASSIIRPGVAKSGMMREYILRYRNPERRKDAHPVLLDIMPDTFGVMVYQEDVIKVAHFFAGLTLGEADMLRRGMSGKFRSREEFAKVQQLFFENCKLKGHSDALAAEVWRQIESFAGYAFAKGHSASYAVESYQSLFLKAHFPLEYMVATLNNGGGFYRPELYAHEARMCGGVIHPPCVNRSFAETVLYDKDILLGFNTLTGFESALSARMVTARAHHGPFLSLDDFIDRVPLGIEQIALLIRIDAFRFTGENKRALLWKAHHKLGGSRVQEGMQPLFKMPRRDFSLPRLASSALEDAYDQIELLGFPLCNPFDLLHEPDDHPLKSADLPAHVHQVITVKGYLVTVKDTRTTKGERMQFGTFVDRAGFFIDTVHFPPAAKQYPFRGRGVYNITGKVTEEFGFYSLEVHQLIKCNMVEDPRYKDEPQLPKIPLPPQPKDAVYAGEL
jgi:DNA polymerase-3 subunit alpha